MVKAGALRRTLLVWKKREKPPLWPFVSFVV